MESIYNQEFLPSIDSDTFISVVRSLRKTFVSEFIPVSSSYGIAIHLFPLIAITSPKQLFPKSVTNSTLLPKIALDKLTSYELPKLLFTFPIF